MPNDVSEIIEKAFADVPLPLSTNICASVGDEATEDTEPFIGKTWRELEDPEFLDRYQYALFWFTPEAFHYYLPAFLKAGLIKPDAIFVVTILQLLRPPAPNSSDNFGNVRWKLLSEKQIVALEEWLRRLLSDTPQDFLLAQELSEALQVVEERLWWRQARA